MASRAPDGGLLLDDGSSRHPEKSTLKPSRNRVATVLCDSGTPRARYSIAKMRAYDSYVRSTTAWRQLAVISLTPLPSLMTSLLPTIISLQDPGLGIARNPGFVVHFFVSVIIIGVSTVYQFRSSSGLSHKDISAVNALCIAMLAALMTTAFTLLLAYEWRFPLPFTWVVTYEPYVASLFPSCAIVLRGKLGQDSTIKASLLGYLPSYFFQGFQVVIYPALSALFEVFDAYGQLILTLLFPVVKYIMRRGIRRLSSHLVDNKEEVAVCGVEISAAMYQSAIMQSTPSPYITAVVIGLDIIQGLHAIHHFMDRQSVVPLVDLVDTAREILGRGANIATDAELEAYATMKKPPQILVWGLGRSRIKPHLDQPSSRRIGLMQTRHSDEQLVTHALEIIQSAESILLTEYFEVSVPIVNALFLLWTSQLKTAIYSPKMRPYYEDKTLLGPALSSLAVYIALQSASVVLMHVVMWRRFRVSALTLLAFVLEHHVGALQAKLVVWLLVTFHVSILHYGVDFKFKFDYESSRESRSP